MARRRQQKGSAARETRRPASPRFNVWLIALLALLFAVKLAILLQLQDHPLLQPDGGLDSAEYVRLAQKVIGGDLALGPGLYYLSPLYIYFLAAGLALSGSTTFVRVAQIALGTAAVGCVFAAARAWFGARAGWFAAGLAALSGVLTFYEIVLFQSSLDTFLTAAALACLATAWRTPEGDRTRLLLAGVLVGLQTLNRPNVGIAAAVLVAAVVIQRRTRASGTGAWGWRPALFLAAGALLALTPVLARNAIVSHQFALASSQGGLNFYIGNNGQATGQYAAVPGVRANISGQSEDTRKVAEAATGRALTDVEVSEYFTRLATAWIREHPHAAAKLFLRKLALVFNARHQWLDFSYPYYAHDTGSSLAWLFVGPWLLVPLGAMGAMGAMGAVAASRAGAKGASANGANGAGAKGAGASGANGAGASGAGTFVLFVFLAAYAVSVAVFFVAERYRLPLLIGLCIPAGAAVDWLLGGWRVSSRSQVAAIVAAGAAAAIVTAWPFAVPDGRFEERLRLSKALMNRGDYGGATLELERAYALRPSDTVTEFNYGMALVSSGRAEEGLAHARHAVDAGVPIDGARYALAGAMLTTGDQAGAVTLLRTYYPAPTDSAQSCFQVAQLALNAGAPRVAERYLQRALALRPGWPEAQALLMQIRQ